MIPNQNQAAPNNPQRLPKGDYVRIMLPVTLIAALAEQATSSGHQGSVSKYITALLHDALESH